MTQPLKHLYVSDLDGTLLQPEGKLSEFARAQLTVMLEAGLPFTVATARSIISVLHLFQGIPLHLPVVELNGSMITDPVTMQRHVVLPVAREILEDADVLAREAGCVPFLSSLEGNRDLLILEGVKNEGEQWYREILLHLGDPRFREWPDVRPAYAAHPTVLFTVIERRDVIYAMEAEINRRWPGRVQTHVFENMYSPGWYWLNIHDGGASKGQGVARLLDLLGLKHNDLTVFGDEVNDHCMFKLAGPLGRAIATGNAIDTLKALATHVIGSNADDSVIHFMAAEHR